MGSKRWIQQAAAVIGPLLMQVPPRVGSRSLGDLFGQARLAWRMRKLGMRGVADLTRLFTMSITDLLDAWFESEQLKGLLAAGGVIGAWTGPDRPGTAYVLLHNEISDVGDGEMGSWGYPRGGMGAVIDRQVLGPYEIEQDLGMIGGNIFHGELSLDQLFHLRPAPGYADYRTPIRDLYNASSGTHGGGGVNGIPGLQAFRQAMRDRAIGR